MFSLNENSAPIEAQRDAFVRTDKDSQAGNNEKHEFPTGALVEISGPGARKRAAKFLAQLGDLPAAWIEENLNPFPQELHRTGMNFDRVLFVHGEEDSSWAASAFLRSGEFPVIIYRAPYRDERELRRFLRLARESGTTFVVLSDSPSPSTLFHLQLRADEERTEVLRRRVS